MAEKIVLMNIEEETSGRATTQATSQPTSQTTSQTTSQPTDINVNALLLVVVEIASPVTTTASIIMNDTTSINGSNSVNVPSCDPEDPTEETIVIWLSLILVIPYVITFLRCVWISLMNWNYEPNPTCRKVSLGIVLATFEAVSLAFLVLQALPASPSVGLIVVNSVFMSAVLTKSISYFKDSDANDVESGQEAGDNVGNPSRSESGSVVDACDENQSRTEGALGGQAAVDDVGNPSQSSIVSSGVQRRNIAWADVGNQSGSNGGESGSVPGANGESAPQSEQDANDGESGSIPGANGENAPQSEEDANGNGGASGREAGSNGENSSQSEEDANGSASGIVAGADSENPPQSEEDANGGESGQAAGNNGESPPRREEDANGGESGQTAGNNGESPPRREEDANGGESGQTAGNNGESPPRSEEDANGGASGRVAGTNGENSSHSAEDANGGIRVTVDQRKIKCVVFCVLFFLILASLAITVALDQYWSNGLYWGIVSAVSLVVLAVCWTPKLQEATILPNSQVNDIKGPNSIQNSTTCWKIGVITNFVKVVVWAFCVFVLCPWINGNNSRDANWRIVPLCSSESYCVFTAFLVNVLCGGLGYLFAILALMMKMHRFGFLLPILLADMTVIIFLIVGIQTPNCANIPWVDGLDLCTQQLHWVPMSITCVLVAAATMIGMVVQLWDVDEMMTTVMEMESSLFYTPGYNSVLLGQWLLLSRRKMRWREEDIPAVRVFICTTMYHEDETEMKQLVEALWSVAKNQTAVRSSESKIKFEAHIFFDDGCKEIQVQDFALQLLSIIDSMKEDEKSLIENRSCKKWRTPYGLQLQWNIPSSGGVGDGGMRLTLHLKDSAKVKNKKRWSQVMYMSYVLDYVLKCPADNELNPLDRDTYILATDADVKFTPESAMALLDLARRDPTVGAVCGRTHPLGSGPMVWYQKFDYAVGHWYQKTANCVLGSVLCCPGCFSVYRAEALRQVLQTYSSGASNAMEFLMKDMGEDRWLCTLMVSNGWRLEYTAVSADSTYCPEEFEEFYNQRRRWGPSAVANQLELLNNYFGNRMNRDSVSFLFMVYQGLLFFSGLIGPATCVLMIGGGLQFFDYFNGTAGAQTVPITTVVILSLVCLLYGLICLRTSNGFQLKIAMFLSLCFAVLMTLVLVALIAAEFKTMTDRLYAGRSYTPSVSTLYFLSLAGMYVITGLVHITEFGCLVYGLVYFLSLPTGFILLTIYSVCNLTDRTWGTREGNFSGQSTDRSLTETISDFFATICGRNQVSNPEPEVQPQLQIEEESESDQEDEFEPPSTAPIQEEYEGDGDGSEESSRRRKPSIARKISVNTEQVCKRRRITVVEIERFKTAKRWLEDELNGKVYGNYVDNFVRHGYSDTSFIASMTDEDLKFIEIDQEPHRIKLLGEIAKLPEFQLETAVPNDVTEWLKMLNLEKHTKTFQDYGVNTKGDLACLRQTEDLDQVMKHLGIEKRGHIQRIKLGIDAMTEPDELQKGKYRVKRILLGCNFKDLVEKKKDGKEELRFWETLRETKINPELAKFSDKRLDEKLISLRNSALVVLLVVNVLWITIMMVLSSRQALKVLGESPTSFLSLAVFGIVQVIQFLAMLYHRLLTLLHYLARLQLAP
ncbi:CASKIN2 [Branchiostoma lanceolatum]|uniref:chitin synthase n=1 Tax=Branchiostoma lanceolatum TaxID=7740 RepID=A0A8J9ZBT5_BRALA|nr:CASKIN2 [Branchiostoma lanceolatum]